MCIHHYYCAIADGETSLCTCIKCGLEQYFLNCIPGEMGLYHRDEPHHNSEILLYPNKPIMSL